MAPGLPKFKIGPFPDFRSSDNTTVIPPSIYRCSDPETGTSGNCAIAQEARVYTRRVISATLVLLTNTKNTIKISPTFAEG